MENLGSKYKQMSLWGFEDFIITKPIRLISLFSGYDSQFLALKYIQETCKRKGYQIPKIEHYKTCEWAVKSIQALYDLHFKNDTTDYTCGMSDNDVVEALTKIGISQNYNDPMQAAQIKRIDYRKVYNQIKASHNLVNIMTTKAEDLEIKDTYLLTYLLTRSHVKTYHLQERAKECISPKPMEEHDQAYYGRLKDY